jgi:hypothetical protein
VTAPSIPASTEGRQAELDSLGAAYTALAGLSEAGIVRAMDWLQSRLKEDSNRRAQERINARAATGTDKAEVPF